MFDETPQRVQTILLLLFIFETDTTMVASYLQTWNSISVYLDDTNYPTWVYLMQHFLRSRGLLKFVDGSFSTSNTTATESWMEQDSSVISMITASLSPEALTLVVGCQTSLEVWITLKKRYAPVDVFQIMQLKRALYTIQKGSDPIEKYLLRIKTIRDHLDVVDVRIPDQDVICLILAGLPCEFGHTRQIIRSKSDLALCEVRALLLSAESEIELARNPLPLPPLPAIIAQNGVNPATSWTVRACGDVSTIQAKGSSALWPHTYMPASSISGFPCNSSVPSEATTRYNQSVLEAPTRNSTGYSYQGANHTIDGSVSGNMNGIPHIGSAIYDNISNDISNVQRMFIHGGIDTIVQSPLAYNGSKCLSPVTLCNSVSTLMSSHIPSDKDAKAVTELGNTICAEMSQQHNVRSPPLQTGVFEEVSAIVNDTNSLHNSCAFASADGDDMNRHHETNFMCIGKTELEYGVQQALSLMTTNSLGENERVSWESDLSHTDHQSFVTRNQYVFQPTSSMEARALSTVICDHSNPHLKIYESDSNASTLSVPHQSSLQQLPAALITLSASNNELHNCSWANSSEVCRNACETKDLWQSVPHIPPG